MSGPHPNINASIDFLHWWRPDGSWLLTAICPSTRSIETRTLTDPEDVKAWLELHVQSRNIYFHVNPALSSLNKKATREDIKELAWLHVDIDPRAGEGLEDERQRALALLTTRLPPGVPPPSAVVFSGGGYQGFWRLEDPMPINGHEEAFEEAKRYNQQLELLFGADNCHNVDRIMRLPGTINWPDAKKAKKGRVPTLAKVISLDDTRFYSIDEFEKAPPKRHTANNTSPPAGADNLSGIDDLDAWEVSPRLKVVIAQGGDPDEPLKGRDQSRSAWLWFVINGLLRAKVPTSTIFAIVTDPQFGISASVLDKGGRAKDYAAKQIAKAVAESADPKLAELNARHAIIANYGDRTMVMSEGTPLQFQTSADFCQRYRNRRVEIGEGKFVRLGDWWLDHPERRQYERVEFLPGKETPPEVYNLWRGWPIAAKAGDCSLLIDLIKNVICYGREDLWEWVLNWMAHAIQHPTATAEVALVLRGGQGVGKSFFAKRFGELFGTHFVPITDPKHVVGNFNKLLQEAQLVFSDEAFAGEDKRSAAILKGLVTEDHITIEPKGVNAFKARKYFRMILASNESRVVTADMDDRRFLVLDVSEARKRDNEYFAAIANEWSAGGREALMHLLMFRDISSFEPRRRPSSPGLVEQQLLSLRGARRTVYDLLYVGEAPISATGPDGCVFIATADLAKETRFLVSSRALAQELSKLVGGAKSARHQGHRGFWIPSLDAARKLWAASVGIDVPWPKDDQIWASRPTPGRSRKSEPDDIPF